jgi:hypothetical protein
MAVAEAVRLGGRGSRLHEEVEALLRSLAVVASTVGAPRRRREYVCDMLEPCDRIESLRGRSLALICGGRSDNDHRSGCPSGG